MTAYTQNSHIFKGKKAILQHQQKSEIVWMKLTESMRDYELEGDLKKEKEIFALGCLSHSTFLFFKCV